MRLLMKPFQLGPYELSHRVVMAPLTRLRASGNGIVHPLAATYYGQRASSGGLLITEATSAASNGNGYLGAPGIYDDSQIAPWRDVAKAVHAKGGRIFMQLYHAGRRSHADVQPDRVRPVGPSEVVHGSQALTEAGWVPNTPNRALRLDEMPAIVEQFRLAAARALAAGFDGVELHGANGYLFDQFMQDNSNLRRDSYGGSIANRVRLLLETAQAVSTVAGSARVGVRLSPSGRVGDMADSDPQALFSHVAASLARLDLAYLHLIEPRMQGTALATATGAPEQPVAAALLRPYYPGAIIVAGGFEPAGAEAILQSGDADLVAFGRHFIANPDLPARICHDWPLAAHDRATFYGGAAAGYTDYPAFIDPLEDRTVQKT